MRRRRRTRILAGVGLLAAGVIAVAIGDRSSSAGGPASPSVLEQIAEKNDDAAMAAAARMKARSEAMAAAADARQRAAEAALDAGPSG